MKAISDLRKGHFLIGMNRFDKNLWTDEGVRQLAEIGADFLISVESEEPLIRLCEKYDIGIISSSNIIPRWVGGDGSNAGKYAREFPVNKLEQFKITYPESPVVWGDYIADEPNSLDFKHINTIVKRYCELFPKKLPTVNLYPNYASVPQNTGNQVISQLGNYTYAEHIEQFVREVDLPYIYFDFYPFTGVFDTYLENLDIVAQACRKSNRVMGVAVQAGAWKEEAMIESFQLEWQVYMCLAYGAKTIAYANYSPGWWNENTSCVNSKGDKNPIYEWVRNINSVLHSEFGQEYLKYEYMGTCIHGDIQSSDNRIKPQLEQQNKRAILHGVPGVTVRSDKAVASGYFKRNGMTALMLVNTHNPFDRSVEAAIEIEAHNLSRIYLPDNIAEKQTIKDNTAYLSIKSGESAFITLSGD